MPLIVMVGLPCSGKSRRAGEIARLLEIEIGAFNAALHSGAAPKTATRKSAYDPTVEVVSEESLLADRATSFATSAQEKLFRGSLLSAVERHLSRDKFVLVDSMNYIKGFRYQLFCLAKNMGTHQHTVYCTATPENVIAWNEASSHYPDHVLKGLLGRLEEPDQRNRWDAPLLHLAPNDSIPPAFIHSLVHSSIQQAPNQSIALKPVAETNYLHEMDNTLKAICDAVLESQRSGFMSGGELKVPGTDTLVFVPSKGISVSEMGRLRRLYAATLNRLTIKVEMSKIADGFVEYVNQNLR